MDRVDMDRVDMDRVDTEWTAALSFYERNHQTTYYCCWSCFNTKNNCDLCILNYVFSHNMDFIAD